MGVKDLWQILDKEGTEYPLSHLSGKCVAVDLSIWVVQSKCISGLKQSKKPHLRNLFFRVRNLLTNGIKSIFVLEGTPPELKTHTIRKRLKATQSVSNGIISRNTFNMYLRECKQLLQALGIPCIKSSGEAEAMCAYLNAKGIVDGCITEDNDALLYGAETIFRDFSTTPGNPHVIEYKKAHIEKELGLDREKLVALALLLGCDYVNGVPQIGKEKAMKFLKHCKADSILKRFKEWKSMSFAMLYPSLESSICPPHCSRCGHLGKRMEHNKKGCSACDSSFTCYLRAKDERCDCSWHSNEMELKIYDQAKDLSDFPNEEVMKEYMDYEDQLPNVCALTWNKPDLATFCEAAFNWFGWTAEESMKNTLPICTSWQMYSLCSGQENCDMFIYDPIKIVKIQKKKGTNFYKVLWICVGDEILDDDNDATAFSEDKCTLENIESFSKAYPLVEKAFLKVQEDKKKEEMLKKLKEKKAPRKTKRKPPPENNSKVVCSDIINLLPADFPITKTNLNILTTLSNDISLTREQLFLQKNTLEVLLEEAIPGTSISTDIATTDAKNIRNDSINDSFLDIPLIQRKAHYQLKKDPCEEIALTNINNVTNIPGIEVANGWSRNDFINSPSLRRNLLVKMSTPKIDLNDIAALSCRAADNPISEVVDGVIYNSHAEISNGSVDSFLDIPLTQRLQLDRKPKAVIPSPVSTNYSPCLNFVNAELSFDSFDACLVKSSCRNLGFNRVANDFDRISPIVPQYTPKGQKAIFSLSSAGNDSMGVVHASTPDRWQSGLNNANNLLSRFEKLQLASPVSFNNDNADFHSSSPLFRSVDDDDDSVICLS